MKKQLIAFLLASLGAACSKAPDVTVPPNVPPNNRPIIEQAVQQLITSCTGLNQYGYDLVKKSWHAVLSSNGGNPYNYHTETWGWNQWLTVTVEVRKNARDLPREWDAPGKVLKYDLGGGTHPGITAHDKLSQLMCGTIPVSNDPNNPDTFLAVPEMKVLDQVK